MPTTERERADQIRAEYAAAAEADDWTEAVRLADQRLKAERRARVVAGFARTHGGEVVFAMRRAPGGGGA